MKYARLSPGTGFNPVQAFMFYSQRIVTPLWLRGMVIALIGGLIRAFQGDRERARALPDEQSAILKTLSEDGFTSLGYLLDRRQCEEIHAYLSDKLLNDRDHSRGGFTMADAAPDARLGDFHLRDVVNCPHVLELANSPLLLGLATRYIGCKPTISNIGIRWSAPELSGSSILQAYHRDCEDWRYFNVLIYLTDVDETGGPHVFIQGTHLTRAPVRLRYLSDAEVLDQYGQEKMMIATGSAGEGFAVDTSGVHKGTAPTGTTRLMFQIQYSLLPCYAYNYEPADCDTNLPLDPYINRLIVRAK